MHHKQLDAQGQLAITSITNPITGQVRDLTRMQPMSLRVYPYKGKACLACDFLSPDGVFDAIILEDEDTILWIRIKPGQIVVPAQPPRRLTAMNENVKPTKRDKVRYYGKPGALVRGFTQDSQARDRALARQYEESHYDPSVIELRRKNAEANEAVRKVALGLRPRV